MAALIASLDAWMPELVLSIGAMLVLLVAVFIKRPSAAIAVTWGVLAFAALGLALAPTPGEGGQAFFGLIVLDAFSSVFRWLALGVMVLTVLMAVSSSDVSAAWRGEYLALLLFIGAGLMMMAEADHLLMAYLSIELVSLSSFVLVGLARDARASEAALKYILFGALASGIMLFGMSLLYGLTGQLSFPAIRDAAGALPPSTAGAVVVAATMILAGLAYKISMVPFHMWTPDIYEGAPIPVTAMLSVGPKAAALALLFRFMQTLAPFWSQIEPVFFILTIVTMTYGNVVAVVQRNVKRLLAYSTIGQVGYLLIGFTVNSPSGLHGLLVYLVAYLFMNLGAFACVTAVYNHTKDESLSAFSGLSRRAPALAFWCAIFMLSLAGIPPLLGFIGKFLLFGSAIQGRYVALAVAGAINSAIALYYYVNIIRHMYLLAPDDARDLRPAAPLRLAVGVCGLATLVLGLFPGAVVAWLGQIANRL